MRTELLKITTGLVTRGNLCSFLMSLKRHSNIKLNKLCDPYDGSGNKTVMNVRYSRAEIGHVKIIKISNYEIDELYND